MNRVDAFDISVLSLEDGVRWAVDAIEGDEVASRDELAATYYPHLLQAIRGNPEVLRHFVVRDKGLALSDTLLDIMSRVPKSAMMEYEKLRALARRFGPGANDWVGRKWESVEEFTRRKDKSNGMQINVAEGYANLSKLDTIELYAMDAFLGAFLCHSMMDLASMARTTSVVSNSAHFDFANGVVIVGLPPLTKPFFEPSSDYVPVLMEDAFGHIIPEMVDIRLSYKPRSGAVSTILKRDLLGYSIFANLEPFARRVGVGLDDVLVDFRSESRLRKEPLFYEYSDGVRRRGVESRDDYFLRVEVEADSRMDEGKILGTIAGICRAYENGAAIYIEGSDGTSSSRFDQIGSPFGFEEGVVDLVATGPEAQVALMGAFTAISGFSIRPV